MTQLKEDKPQEKTNLELSIQISLNGLSFCMLQVSTNEVFYFKKIAFKKKLTPTEALQQIKLLYARETALQSKIDKAVVTFSNNLYSLVPHVFFKEENAPDYLKYNAKILQTDYIAHDLVLKPQIVNVYIPYTNISNYFFEVYGEFEYKHSVSVLMEAVLNLPRATRAAHMYININQETFDLVVVENEKILLCNTFYFETKEDFIYYVLFTAEQLKLDTSIFNLVFLGGVEKKSELFNIAYTYVKNVDIFKQEENHNFLTAEIQENFQHEFILMHALQNEDSFRNT